MSLCRPPLLDLQACNVRESPASMYANGCEEAGRCGAGCPDNGSLEQVQMAERRQQDPCIAQRLPSSLAGQCTGGGSQGMMLCCAAHAGHSEHCGCSFCIPHHYAISHEGRTPTKGSSAKEA